MLSDDLIEQVLQALPGKAVDLLGDLFLDRYLDIDALLTEPSIETGLDAYQVVGVRSYPGALGTVINNLAALGVGRIVPVAVIGDDGEGYELRQALGRIPQVDAAAVISWEGRRTPTYTKPMLGEMGRPARELNRLDIKNRSPTPAAAEDAVMELLARVWSSLDALVVLDQVSEDGCGVVTGRVRDRLAELAAADPERFVLADSRERVGRFRNVCVKPNEDELRRAAPAESGLSGRLDRLVAATGRAVFLTRGAEGMLVGDQPGFYVEVPAYPVSGPTDPVGAGDSCSAGIVAATVAGASPYQAAAFGNLVASITVQQLGTTGTARPDQVRQRWHQVQERGA
jgi:bifunctional ADP-heptose synthase (sugar kinase/adenylyltransferase)